MVILEKRDREADERKIMVAHGLVRESLTQQLRDTKAEEIERILEEIDRFDARIAELREEAALSAREQVSERINRRPQNNVPRFYNFKK